MIFSLGQRVILKDKGQKFHGVVTRCESGTYGVRAITDKKKFVDFEALDDDMYAVPKVSGEPVIDLGPLYEHGFTGTTKHSIKEVNAYLKTLVK